MRQLYVLRGIPGSGKSTFIQQNGLAPYTLTPDDLRLVMASPLLNTEGRVVMPNRDDAAVWKLLREMLEKRLARGELVVVDATHTTPSYFHDYAKLAQKYRYKLHAVDFADVPLEVCKERNLQRAPYKIVPDRVIDDMYKRVRGAPIPKQWQVLKPDDVAATLANDVVDLNQYKRIHHIGDIQGCATPLKRYFEQFPLVDDEYYVFIGDLLDRGNENAEVLQYVCEHLVYKPNVLFIEGNHEQHLWNWFTHQPVHAREFEGRTREQLEAATIDRGAVNQLFRNIQQALLYTYQGKTVLVTHGGVSTLPEQLKLIPTQQLIHGVGSYGEVGTVSDTFVATTPDTTYQIHGHRNQQDYPLQYNTRCFNLEGKVEFGGALRTVQLSEAGFTPVEIPNPHAESQLHPENAAFIHQLRTNRQIVERTLPGSISSFNFKREVFYNQSWTQQIMTARGLFVHTLTNDIVIRAYDKFFNIGERRDTELSALKDKLAFPVKAWVKENGYLGLLGYDAVAGELVFASKSTTEGDFAAWFKEHFVKLYGSYQTAIRDYLRETNTCSLFEVLLPVHDPHIIAYSAADLVLLDVTKRQQKFEALSDAERQTFATDVAGGMRTKRLAGTFENWAELESWLNSLQGLDYTYEDHPIEGFVLEDANHYHVKAKLDYYGFWKQMRSALDAIKDGRQPRVPQEGTYHELAQKVIAFMAALPGEELSTANIIQIRRKFLRDVSAGELYVMTDGTGFARERTPRLGHSQAD